jgi:hypothetical protein
MRQLVFRDWTQSPHSLAHVINSMYRLKWIYKNLDYFSDKRKSHEMKLGLQKYAVIMQIETNSMNYKVLYRVVQRLFQHNLIISHHRHV